MPLSFVPPLVDYPRARKLAPISEILDKLPVPAELVPKDFVKATKAGHGGDERRAGSA